MKRSGSIERRTPLRARPKRAQLAPAARASGVDPAWAAAPRVSSTTARPAAAPAQERRGEVLVPSYLAWAREQPCMFPWSTRHQLHVGHAGGDAHHEPATGSRPAIDLCVAAACRGAHELAHQHPAAGGWSVEEREAAAHRTWSRFWRLAPAELRRRVAIEIAVAVGA